MSAQPSARSPDRPRVALFDLDHTLLQVDSDHSWGVFTTEIGWTDPHDFARRNDEFYQAYKAGTLDIHAYVRFATEAVRARGPEEARAAHARFMQQVVLPAVPDASRALVSEHRRAGDITLIVTATNEFVTEPISALFAVDELIAVRLARDAFGWFTGEIEGVPSAREGKVVRLQQWLADRRWDWADVHTTFYTDSINDLPLLERVDVPVATNPDPRLRELALTRGWRVLDLFEKK